MSLPVYFAPLEGVTDAVYRRVHHAHFSGIDKYFIPFISPTQNLVLTPRERNNVSPEVNQGLCVVPQVLTKKADHFLWAAQLLHDMGYEEINLNVGCPSGTVTSKGKGAGMLQRPDDLGQKGIPNRGRRCFGIIQHPPCGIRNNDPGGIRHTQPKQGFGGGFLCQYVGIAHFLCCK